MADLRVKTGLSLAEAAAKISDRLQINLIRDISGKYEEIPAYVSSALGFNISLIGEDPEYSSNTNTHIYSLIVSPDGDLKIVTKDGWFSVDLSSYLESKLANLEELRIYQNPMR